MSLCLATQPSSRLAADGFGDELRRIAFATADRPRRNRVAGDFAADVDDFLHARAVAGAEVELECTCRGCSFSMAGDVGGGQVVDVDVVADAGAVGRGVVGAEDVDRLALAERDLQDERDEVRFGVVVFADRAVGGGAGGVEVAEGGVAEAVGVRVVGQRVLDDQLGEAVGIDRRSAGGLR